MSKQLIEAFDYTNVIPKELIQSDERLSRPSFNVMRGASSIEYKFIPSSGNAGTTNTSYTIQPNPAQLVSTYFVEEAQIQVDFRISRRRNRFVLNAACSPHNIKRRS